jgi:hypothetical protein
MTEKDSHNAHYSNKQASPSFSSQSENSSTNNSLNYQNSVKNYNQRDSLTTNHRESLSVPENSVSTYNEDSIHKVFVIFDI